MNGDKIRNMTNEELAAFFADQGYCAPCPYCLADKNDCKKCWETWLDMDAS